MLQLTIGLQALVPKMFVARLIAWQVSQVFVGLHLVFQLRQRSTDLLQIFQTVLCKKRQQYTTQTGLKARSTRIHIWHHGQRDGE